MYTFCTLFDKNYLSRGITLYDSLLKQCPDFKLWVLCMDTESYGLLNKLNLKKIIPIKLEEVEDGKLLSVKNSRSPIEYCWMMSSTLPLYILEHNDIESITYLDADMYFFNSPEPIYKEFGDNSIMIIPHNFPRDNKKQEKLSGIYNVGMMIFRKDENGLACLRWWKDRVIEWCYSYYDDGKLGDQMYLDDWPERFKRVYILKNLGANVASWNIDRYNFFKDDNVLKIKDKETKKVFPLIFYHYHGLKFFRNKTKIEAYPISALQKEIYKKYIEGIRHTYNAIWNYAQNWDFGFAPKISIIKIIKQKIMRHIK